MLNKIIGFFSAAALALVLVSSADAAVLKNAWLNMGTSVEGATTNHSFRFFHPGNDIGSVQFQYCTTASDAACGTVNVSNAGASITGATSVTNGGSNDGTEWTISKPSVQITRATRSSAEGAGNNTWLFRFDDMQNPSHAGSDCTTVAGTSTETCYIRINTYPATDYTGSGHSSIITFTVTQLVTVSATVDPSFTMIIAGINQGNTANVNNTPLTANITPSVTTLPFGNLQPGTPKFIGQSATVTTNATNGYSITVAMNGNMTGTAYGDDIDPFAVVGAAYNDAESWASPTGNASGTNTGWLGVGTNDTGVTGYASNGFFSLGAVNPVTVASETTSVQSQVNQFVYGIEVNAYQEADSYTGTLRYNALPVY